MKQFTLKKRYTFEGKGLHTGKYARMIVGPASENTGIVFIRTDIGPDARIPALAENVSDTSRSTSLSFGDASVSTVEHILSALTGLGVDNASIEIDNQEIPILNGSASIYAEAFGADGLEEQNEERHYLEIPDYIEVNDERTGSFIRISPAPSANYEITVDFNSRVLGVQTACWTPETDYATEIAPCRTFVFFHEIEYLFKNNLIKGGDIDNATVIVERPVSEAQLQDICRMMGKDNLKICDNGLLNNVKPHFPNECGRHKMLDLIGDLRLCGGFLNAGITGFKPGHSLNTKAAQAIRSAILENKEKAI